MIVYYDILTGQELFSDSYPLKLVDDVYYRVKCKLNTESNKFDDALIGGNASAEAEVENVEDSSVSGVNIVMAHSLKELPEYDRKQYLALFKEYANKLKKYYTKNDQDKLDGFQDRFLRLHTALKTLLKNESFQFFQTEGASGEGMFALLGYEEDGTTPYMIFFKDGLREEKV